MAKVGTWRLAAAPLAILCVALTACTAPNPAYDQASSTSSAGSSSQPTSSPGESSTSLVDPTTSTSTQSVDSSGLTDTSSATSSATSTSTSTATTTDDTTGPACIAQGDVCTIDQTCCGECATCSNGTCVLDDALCGICGVCDAGSCAPAKQNTPCVPDQADCTNRVWGLENGVCYATKPAGECDKIGSCIPDCQDKGMMIAMCDPRCVRDDVCASGGDPDKIEFDTLCHHQGLPAGTCTPECNPEGTSVLANRCNDSGLCMSSAVLSCDPYLCEGSPGICTDSCVTSGDCAPGRSCINLKCT